jgi:hypothetical protein
MNPLEQVVRDLIDQAPGAQDAFAQAVRAAVVAAAADGRFQAPAGLKGHGTRLEQAFLALRGQKKGRTWHLDQLIEWMVRRVEMDIDMFQGRLQRDQPELGAEAVRDQVAARVAARVEAGCFGDVLTDTTDLATSAWNGQRHELVIQDWIVRVEQPVAGQSIRLGSTRFPIAPAVIPGSLTAVLRLRSGTLLVDSDVPGKELAAACVAMRQAGEGKGLEHEIAVTRQLLGERQILAFGVHVRSLAFRVTPTGFAIVAPKDSDEEAGETFLLDYRHLALIDSAALLANLAETWDEPAALTEAKRERALAAFTGKRFQVEHGRYSITLPANHQRALRTEKDGTIVLLEAARLPSP